ncbi:AmmeMemoRadiSam system radical SAM enzyme [Candidatus Sumerlaeota bacterium]|nr:AmmeMemoRadiSam system radical SAM enzyme [Candidatus Sumerlaeota bacterium]
MGTLHPYSGRWWEAADEGRIRCVLCPRECLLREGQAGFCYVRQNTGGVMRLLAYGRPSALQVDPIEKKPLNHFMPGTNILSIGTPGCNLGCRFCQNHDLSKARADERRSRELSPRQAVELALAEGCHSLAFTYNEPTIWAEYAIDIAQEAHREGLKTVAVTSGYIGDAAFDEFYAHMDAANVDIKAFTPEFYRKLTLSDLGPVKWTIQRLRKETKVWFELTNLIIPTKNDSEAETRELCKWITGELGPDVPLHFTAFHPAFKMMDLPRTPVKTLSHAREIALDEGLHYVYVGNVHDSDGQTTWCPNCGKAVIRRDWHALDAYALKGGCCQYCGQQIAGYFPDDIQRDSSGWVRPLPI